MGKKLVIDRFEGIYAVCEDEDGTMINIEKSTIEGNPIEGDIIVISENKIIVDQKATNQRQKEIEELTKDLWKE